MLLFVSINFTKLFSKKKLPFFLLLIICFNSYGQNCADNWLSVQSNKASVSIGDLDIQGKTLTIEAIFNRTEPYAASGQIYAGDIVSKHKDPDDANYLLRPNTAEITTTDGYFRTPDICDIELNKTYHVAMVYDGSSLKFYRNGFLMAQTPCSGDLITNDWPTTFGTTGYLQNVLPIDFIGYINEVRIWNVARTQEQIKQYVDKSLPNPSLQTGLLAYYIFDDLKNKQGNSLWNGQINNNATVDKSNPECSSYVIDSCSKLISVDPIVTAGFTIPDTVCVNTLVEIKNTTTGGTNFYWNFCTADINQVPLGTNLGNLGNQLSQPVFIDLAQADNGDYYGLSINHIPGQLIRYNFGNSYLNDPVVENLGDFGGAIPNQAEGIQIVKENGTWYAIIVGGGNALVNSSPRIVTVNFGNALSGASQSATNWGNVGNMNQPLDLHVFQEGDTWYGFTVNALNNTITRFNFSDNFDSAPTGVNLGNIGDLAYPTGIYAINDNGDWKVFISNGGNGTRTGGKFSLSRLDFGSSLLNTPVGINLGNPGKILQHPRDITIMKYCDEIVGFAVNGLIGSDDLLKMNFNNDLSSVPTIISLGNLGNLNFPVSISKIFRTGPDLYSFIANAANNTFTRLKFSGCTNSSISNSSDSTPPAIKYSVPGIYNINVMIDEGLPTQTSFCKSIVVVAPLENVPIYDTSFCSGDSLILTTNFPTGAHSWSTGSIDTSITVNVPGTYWVDNQYYGCLIRDSINVLKNVLPVVFLGSDTSICNLDSVIIDAGNTGSTYYWQDSSILQTYTVKASGIYSVSVKDANGCINNDSVDIKLNGAIMLKVNSDTTICNGAGISLSASGNNIKTYSWSPTGTLSDPFISNPVAHPPDTTVYFITATDISGCTGTDSIYVNVAPLPVVQLINDTSLCNLDSLVINAGNTNTGVTYLWQDGSIQQTYLAKSTGVYSVAVKDANGCIAKDSVTVNVNAAIQLQLTGDTTICTGTNIALAASGNRIQTYLWSPAGSLSNAGISNPLASPVNTTVYYINVIDSSGCTNTDSILVNVAQIPIVTTIPDSAVCTGTSIVLATSGSDSVSYSWSPTAYLSNSNIKNPVATAFTATEYIVTATNNAGCIAKDSVNISLKALPAVTAFGNTTVCPGANVQLQALSPGNNIFYWYPATALSNANISNPVASPAASIQYYVQVTAANNCVNTDSVQVAVVPKPLFSVQPAAVSICTGAGTLLTASGGNIFQWFPAATVQSPSSSSTLVYPLQNTVYKVVITNNICNVTDSVFATVNINARPDITLTKSNDVDCVLGQAKLLATGGVKYAWSPASSLSAANLPNPVATPIETTTYHVLVTGISGCIIEDSLQVKVIKGEAANGYLLPTAFTPNGDNQNDCFGVKSWGFVTGLDFSVYNRWGNLVFHTTNAADCWNGTYKGEPQQQGTFIYQVRANTICGDVYRKGTVILIR